MIQHAAIHLVLVCLLAACHASAQEQPVSLPHVFSDASGSNWDVQYDGSIGDGGNDLYDGGGRLFLNNMFQYQSPNSQATLDAARNELTFPPMMLNGLNVSRRVAVLGAQSTVRFIEILENPTGAPIKVLLRCYFNMGGTVQQSIPLVDDKHPRAPAGYAISDQNNSVAMIGCGRGAKVQPRFNFRQNDDNVDIYYDIEVPARQTVAIVHFQLRRHSASEAADAWKQLKERDLLKNIPRDLRKKVVNFPAGDNYIGDLEILRGDVLDAVELRSRDIYRGSIMLDQFHLQTVYGPVNIPAGKVVGLINVGVYRPNTLVITTEGEVFGGRLDHDAIKLRMTSGQVTTIPLSQISRLGFRKRPGEVEEWNFEHKAMVYLGGSQRVRVKLPAGDFNLATTSGPLRLNPSLISSIVFQGEESHVPEVRLVDGSHISALLGASSFDMTLAGLGQEQSARMPAAALLRFAFAPEQETSYLTPVMTLTNQDELVGTIGGTLSLQTPFDTLHIEGCQIKQLTHLKNAGDHDVQITMWDGGTLSGRLVESHVTCLLKCGISVRVPVPLIEIYQQPLPLPSPPVIDRIKRTVHSLEANDWKTRTRAQSEILAIGPSGIAVLKELRPTAPAEAAQRIDVMLNLLSSDLESASGATPASAPMAAPVMEDR